MWTIIYPMIINIYIYTQKVFMWTIIYPMIINIYIYTQKVFMWTIIYPMIINIYIYPEGFHVDYYISYDYQYIYIPRRFSCGLLYIL